MYIGIATPLSTGQGDVKMSAEVDSCGAGAEAGRSLSQHDSRAPTTRAPSTFGLLADHRALPWHNLYVGDPEAKAIGRVMSDS